MATSSTNDISAQVTPSTSIQVVPATQVVPDKDPAVEIKMKETFVHAAAIGIEETHNGDTVIKGMEVVMHKKEVQVESEGFQAKREIFVMYNRYFEVYLNRIEYNECDGVPEYKPTTFETVTYGCCQAYSCDCKGCCNHRCLKSSNVRKRFEEPASLKKANVLFNLFPPTIRELTVYFGLLATFVSFIISLIALVRYLNGDKEQIEKVFKIIGFVISFIGLVFTAIDVSLHFRHNGCRLAKRCCKAFHQHDDHSDNEDIPEYCSETCTCKGKCGRSCVAFMDAIRVFVLETIFYPKLLLAIFQFIVLLDQNNYDPKMVPWLDWISTVWTFLSSLFLVYVLRMLAFANMVISTHKIRIKGKKCQGILFVLMFVLYMYGLMALQIMMIVIISARFHHDYTQLDKRVSGQLWYMMVCAFLMPVLGMAMFFVVHHFWTMKFPLDLIFEIFWEFQTKGKKRIMGDEKGIENAIKYLGGLDQLTEDYACLQKRKCDNGFFYPFTSPLHIILCLIYSGMLLAFSICCVIEGPDDDWLYFLYFIAGLLGSFINIYCFAVFGCWLGVLLFLLVSVAAIAAICLLCCFCSTVSSNDDRR